MRYIELEAAVTAVDESPCWRNSDDWYEHASVIEKSLRAIPAVDAVEVVHGRWIDLRQEGDSRFMCSACKWKEHVPTCMGKPTVWEYCPSCGARMDGDGNG